MQKLTRVKNVCAQRPQVLKHFRHLLLQKNQGNELKVLLDAPELFDDHDSPQDSPQESAPHGNLDVVDGELPDQVNSLQTLNSNIFTTFQDENRSSNVATFPNNAHSNHQILCDDIDNDASGDHFFILYCMVSIFR
jgi:hypothetical protein